MTTMVVAWFLLNRGEGEEERGGVGWVEGGPRRRRRRRGGGRPRGRMGGKGGGGEGGRQGRQPHQPNDKEEDRRPLLLARCYASPS